MSENTIKKIVRRIQSKPDYIVCNLEGAVYTMERRCQQVKIGGSIRNIWGQQSLSKGTPVGRSLRATNHHESAAPKVHQTKLAYRHNRCQNLEVPATIDKQIGDQTTDQRPSSAVEKAFNAAIYTRDIKSVRLCRRLISNEYATLVPLKVDAGSLAFRERNDRLRRRLSDIYYYVQPYEMLNRKHPNTAPLHHYKDSIVY